MQEIMVAVSSERTRTRILINKEGKEVLKAVLPAVTIAHRTAARTLLQGLALWFQQRLCVVLCVDEQHSCSDTLQLYEDLGETEQQLHYQLAVVPHVVLRQGQLSEIYDFSDLRELNLGVQP